MQVFKTMKKIVTIIGLAALCASAQTTNTNAPIVIPARDYAAFVAYQKAQALQAQRYAVMRSVQNSTNTLAMQVAATVLTNSAAASSAASILSTNR